MATFRELASGLHVPSEYSGNGEVVERMQESLKQLEQQLMQDDSGWVRLTGFYDKRDLSRPARDVIESLAYAFWLKNPLIARAVETENNYVFGKGVSISAEDDDVETVINHLWNDPQNRAELTSMQGQFAKNSELKLFGNVFIALITEPTTGEVNIRSIPQGEIADIVYDPDDRRRPLYYKWVYHPEEWDWSSDGYKKASGKKVEYIPDLRHPEQDPDRATRDDMRILHVFTNKLSDGKWGNSQVYRAIDWAKAYTRFLEDWATLVASYSKFAFKLKSAGPASKVAKRFRQEFGGDSAPAAGSTWVEREGAGELIPMPQGGPSVSSADGRRFLLMVSAGMGIWEHYFGDPSTGNLATSTAMELPMLKAFEARQQLWKDVLREIVEHALEQSMKSQAGILSNYSRQVEDAYGNEKWELTGDKSDSFEIDFPAIVEKEVPEAVQTLVVADQAGKIPSREAARLIMTHLGLDEIEEHLDELFPEGEEEEPAPEQFADALESLLEKLEGVET